MPSYLVFKLRPGQFKIVRWDTTAERPTPIGVMDSKKAAMRAAALLAGWRGRVAFTSDPSTYPWVQA